MHRRVAFAEAVRQYAYDWRPDVIAVELPPTLLGAVVEGARRLPAISAVCFEEPGVSGELRYIPIDPCDAIVEAVRLAGEHGIELAAVDLDVPGVQEPWRFLPGDMAAERAGLEAFTERIAPYLATPPEDRVNVAREARMARRLRELGAGGRRVMCVLGLAHYAGVREFYEGDGAIPDPRELCPNALEVREGVTLAHVARRGLVEALGEIPFVTHLYNVNREEEELTGSTNFDKLDAIGQIFKQAGDTYRERYREGVSMPQRKALLQYSRNLAITRGAMRPDFYELVISAAGVVDGDYGMEVYELASSYPPQRKRPGDGLARLFINRGKGALEGREEKFRLRSRVEDAPTVRTRMTFRRRPTARMREQWREQWMASGGLHFGICSWPPEDRLQEQFMDFIRKRALQALGEDRRHVEEFKTSMLDGLDLRETMRNWHTGKFFVHSTPAPRGRVGAVVLIFEDEHVGDGRFFPWRSTLYAENQNESDIAFYATPIGANVVGPRICRTEFGGIMSIFPALGIPDIWRFEMGPSLRWCSEALMAGAILFSPDRYVAYVAQRAPTQIMRQLAAVYGKRIIHLPLSRFSSRHLKKVRKFHILDGHDVRRYARDYIFED